MTFNYEVFQFCAKIDKDGYILNPLKLDGLQATDVKSVGTKFLVIVANTTTGSEYTPIGELYGFSVLVKMEVTEKDAP